MKINLIAAVGRLIDLDMCEWTIESEEDMFTKDYIITNYVYMRKQKKDDNKHGNREVSKGAPTTFNGNPITSPSWVRR